jgi:hypothetical protein
MRFIIAALAVSMVVAGPNLALLQQHQGHAASQTKKQEQSTIQSLRGNFAKRSITAAASQQHLDQENQCLRAGKCGNADLGQQTLGNDNSVTGFTDQSKNVQARVVVTPPTPTPTPTLSTTPRPAFVLFHILCGIDTSCEGVTFSITVTLNGAKPSSFTLRDNDGQFVRFDDLDTYTVTETPVTGFRTFFIGPNCVQTGPNSAIGPIGTKFPSPTECDIENIQTNNLLSQNARAPP